MRKMIVKSQLADRAAFEEQLAGIGMKLSPVRWQHERVYVPRDFRPQTNQPRMVMRTEMRAVNRPPQYAMYLKRHIEDSGLDFVHVTPVENYLGATGIIHQLGFRKLAEVSRQRREVRLDEKMVIYVDAVERLDGEFIKIEADLAEDETVGNLKESLFRTLKMLGIEMVVFQTYAEMIESNLIQPYYLP